jgi:hypothetical protein
MHRCAVPDGASWVQPDIGDELFGAGEAEGICDRSHDRDNGIAPMPRIVINRATTGSVSACMANSLSTAASWAP